MRQAEFALGGLEAILNHPAMSLDSHERLDGCSRRAPSGEAGHLLIGDVATDQQTTRPQSFGSRAELISFEVCQLQAGPIVQALALRAQTGGKTSPGGSIESFDDLIGSPRNHGFAVPGAEVVGGVHAEHVASARAAQRHLDIADAIELVPAGTWAAAMRAGSSVQCLGS